ncbi:Sec1-like protein [Atractiella rhizophila]|nr:Sec1-like protein [Atractiella rhizophila]
MDPLLALRNYVTRMLSIVPGMKVLLLDSSTTAILSMCSTQSSLLSAHVYLTDRIDSAKGVAQKGERMAHLKCLVFVRPTNESLGAVRRELESGRYGEYYLFFSNVLSKSAIESLALSDTYELVREVSEYFGDFLALSTSHYSLLASPPSSSTASTSISDAEGLLALLLALKKKPVVRYERMSSAAKTLGKEMLRSMEEHKALFDFRPSNTTPLLLILDRRNDPVTPLLTQWTYQAMVHEEIGIRNGRVDLRGAPDIREELKEIVLPSHPSEDPFYSSSLYLNFGDLGSSLTTYVSDYSSRTASSNLWKIETVQDMKRFVEEYPEFRKLGGNVSKHVALVGELSRLVGSRKLLEVSELEQSLASNESHASDFRNLQQMITSDEISVNHKLRLSILYALRYQKSASQQISHIVDLLTRNGLTAEEASLVNVILSYAGADQRQDDLFANENFFSRGKSALKGLKGVDNVYTQHTPHLAETIDLLLKGRLKETSYPFIEGQTFNPTQRPQDIIIFMVGGTTYEEARHIALLNQKFQSGEATSTVGAASGTSTPAGAINANTRILLGGSCVHNSASFLEMLRTVAGDLPAPPPLPVPSGPAPVVAASSTSTSTPASTATPASNQGLNLSIGNVSINVSGANMPNAATIEAGVEGAKEGVRNLIGGIKRGVEFGKVMLP